MEPDAATSMLRKLRAFVEEELDADERALFGALVIPAIARAIGSEEVEGFGLIEWSPDVLPAALVDALRDGWPDLGAANR